MAFDDIQFRSEWARKVADYPPDTNIVTGYINNGMGRVSVKQLTGVPNNWYITHIEFGGFDGNPPVNAIMRIHRDDAVAAKTVINQTAIRSLSLTNVWLANAWISCSEPSSPGMNYYLIVQCKPKRGENW